MRYLACFAAGALVASLAFLVLSLDFTASAQEEDDITGMSIRSRSDFNNAVIERDNQGKWLLKISIPNSDRNFTGFYQAFDSAQRAATVLELLLAGKINTFTYHTTPQNENYHTLGYGEVHAFGHQRVR